MLFALLSIVHLSHLLAVSTWLFLPVLVSVLERHDYKHRHYEVFFGFQ